jgi:hypothetical protein
MEIRPGGWIEITSRIQMAIFIRTTHKRTEGRAPVWDSEFTTKNVHCRGFNRNRCWAKL